MKKLIAIVMICLLLTMALPVSAAQLKPAQWITEGGAEGVYLSSDAHSGSYSLAHAGTDRYNYATYQEIAVPNGTYSLSGYVKSSGGQSGCWIAVSQYGGNELRASISAAADWQQVSVENIQVTAGKAVITVWSNTAVQAWLLVDDLQMIGENGENLLTNGDFETVGAVQQVEEQPQDTTPPEEAIKNVASKFFSKWQIYADPSADVAYQVPGGHDGQYCGVHYFETIDYTASTCQLLAGLPSGSYGATVWVKSSGGQSAAQLVVKAGGRNYVTGIPATDAWTQISVLDVPVTEGTLEVSVWSDAQAGQWIMYDSFAAFSMNDPSVNLMSNPGFETLGASPLEQDASNLGAEGAGGEDVQETLPTIPQLELNEEEPEEPAADSKKKLDIDWLFVGSIAIIVVCTALSLTTTILLLKKGKKQ